MRPTSGDLKTIWLLCYSRAAFLDARRWLDEMETARDDSHNEALVYAAVVAYCRPFTKSQVTEKERVIPLDGVSPPQHLADAHENLLHSRDKIIGHRDAVPTKGYSRSANPLLLDRFGSTYQLNTTRLGKMEPEQREAAKELCAYFMVHCETQLSAIIGKYRPELMRHREGMYELLISEPPDDWIRPFSP